MDGATETQQRWVVDGDGRQDGDSMAMDGNGQRDRDLKAMNELTSMDSDSMVMDGMGDVNGRRGGTSMDGAMAP